MMIKASKIAAFSFILITLMATNVFAKTSRVYKPATSSIVIEASSGKVLYSRNADKLRYPASLTKMMTLLLTFDALESGAIQLDTQVRISRNATTAVPSKLGLKAGSTISVEDAIYILVTKSANDIAIAMGEHLGGSEEKFAQMMTNRARTLGMRRTYFKNASGLHNKKQVTTARDMARLSQVIITHYSKYYHYFGTKSFKYNGRNYKNHNHLMNTYPGMDGMKTGYVAASGFNLVASSVRGNKRLIGVVFGGPNSKSRNAKMARILDASFTRIGVDVGNSRLASSTLKAVSPPPSKPRSSILLASIGSKQTFYGEGDAETKAGEYRINAGLSAVKMHRQLLAQPPIKSTSHNKKRNWGIQVGAFAKRDDADKATRYAFNSLPNIARKNGRRTISPVYKKSGGVVFRGQIAGYSSRQEATQVCSLLPSCIPVEVNQ